MNNMNQDLEKFLKTCPKKDNKFTHVFPKKGSYYIEPDKLEQFYELIYKEFFVNNKTYMCAEKVADVCPLVLDLDFKYKNKYNKRQYSRETIDEIIQLVFKAADELFNLESNQYNVWIFEKDNIRDCDKTGYESKDGLHMTFPKIKADKYLYKLLVEKILEDKELFNDILLKTCENNPDNNIEDIVDSSIYNTNWLVYGSRKTGEGSRYELTRIVNLNSLKQISDTDISIYLQNPKTIIKNNSVYQTNVNTDYTEISKEYLKTKNLNTNSNISFMDLDMEEENSFISNLKEKEIELIKTLVDKLNPERATPYEDWRNVGLLLHGISKRKVMLDIWKSFSRKSPNYNEESCNNKWKEWQKSTRNENVLTIKTLHWWVRQDIPIEEYRDIIKESLITKISLSLEGEKNTGAHYDVANVIADYYKNEFVCSGLKENYWYHFNELKGGKWEATEIGHELRKKLSNEIVHIYFFYMKKYQSLSEGCEDGSIQKQIYDKMVANCGKIISKLKDSSYKDKIIRECRELFYDPEFDEKINSNLDLLGFDNGIFDLKRMEFRKGQPDDYVTITTKYSIPITNLKKPVPFEDLYNHIKCDPTFTEVNKELNDFIAQVLPNRVDSDGNRTDTRIRDYVLRFLSSCLSGNVREEKFYFWTGSGGNGKSKIIELLDLSLGDYSKTLDVAYLTTKRGSSSSASPEIETLKYARFVSCSEPEEHDKIYVGKLKQITGGDKLTTRGLFKETTEFKPQFKIVLMCNELPKLQNQDGGTWRRIEVVNFISKFSDNPQPTEEDPNQFIADIDLSNKLDNWKLMFMLTLLSKFQDYTEMGTNPPEEVKEGTNQYKQDSDIITNWFNSDVEECELVDGLAPTSMDTLYECFKDWAQGESIDKKDLPPKKKIKEALLKYQEKSKYGLSLGKNSQNGTKGSPKFTFKHLT